MVIRTAPGVALLYHDIVARERATESGIVTDGSWRYKLPPEIFRSHLERIDASSHQVVLASDTDAERPLLLTFDDGGVSCAETAAPLLESYGMRGNFFVVTGRLGDDGYMTEDHVRELAAAGHHVGSHTVTHANLREVSPSKRRAELVRSKEALESLLGTTCRSISIPGGFVDEDVLTDAFDAGYDYVFISEPRYLSLPVKGSPVGRWSVWHDTGADGIERILDRNLRTRLWVQGRWFTLKSIKRTIGQNRFERLRRPLVSRR
ncbi:polysaccharide deacetylase family protein [Halosegnis marinus]|uniref:Polysaccharide deacetylase family protein n=1 Tax=Halosegnis marinus TaxID=3034023 RepID=A0ABD5ZQG3_9EURY|nr:polysaccharide deacetylase family protein [Halosegnis sp. DT85]